MRVMKNTKDSENKYANSLIRIAITAILIIGTIAVLALVPPKTVRLLNRTNIAFKEFHCLSPIVNITPEQLEELRKGYFVCPHTVRDKAALNSITQYQRGFSGDLITSARVANVRVYRLPTNMHEAKEEVLRLLKDDEDGNITQRDVRLSMHPERKAFTLESLSETCSPGMFPLKSNTWATVIFGDTFSDVLVGLDSDAQVIDLEKYERESCNNISNETYLTIVMWAM